MYVDPFAAGVITTLFAEMLVFIVVGIFHGGKK